jgi:serine protease AprX
MALAGVAAPSQAAELSARPGAALASAGSASPAGSYIVRARAGQLDAVAALLAGQGVALGRRIALIDAVVAQLPTGAAARLRSDARVLAVTANASVQMLGSSYDPVADVNSLYNSEKNTSVRGGWENGATGAGIDVAVVDSGVSPVEGLSTAGKIINGPDLTPESQNAATRYLDTYGHGTHMAGIIAGHDAGVTTRLAKSNTTHFLGVAADARIVSVKVADAHGSSDVSQVIAGIDWVVQHARDPGMNIRVLNLSFGTNSTQSYTLDPLAFAAEIAWHKGIVVVVSAGNSGSAGITNPAIDPFVIAVGAADTRGTKITDDDEIPSFSSQGLGNRDPDVVAPGVHVQSLRVAGSYVDTKYAGSGAIDSRFFRGSGTSQAAAFVSGAAALLIQAHPSYTPDQIKDQLRRSARKLPVAKVTAQGSGLVRIEEALGTQPSSVPQSFVRSTGTGSLEAARGDAHLQLNGVVLTGELDINGKPFDSVAVAAATPPPATGSSWAGGTWNGSSWAGSSWAGSSWAGSSWAGSSWAGSSWAGSSWASGSWNGSSWAGSSWAGSSWAGSSWASGGWSGSSWAGNVWSDCDWS